MRVGPAIKNFWVVSFCVFLNFTKNRFLHKQLDVFLFNLLHLLKLILCYFNISLSFVNTLRRWTTQIACDANCYRITELIPCKIANLKNFRYEIFVSCRNVLKNICLSQYFKPLLGSRLLACFDVKMKLDL